MHDDYFIVYVYYETHDEVSKNGKVHNSFIKKLCTLKCLFFGTFLYFLHKDKKVKKVFFLVLSLKTTLLFKMLLVLCFDKFLPVFSRIEHILDQSLSVSGRTRHILDQSIFVSGRKWHILD